MDTKKKARLKELLKLPSGVMNKDVLRILSLSPHQEIREMAREKLLLLVRCRRPAVALLKDGGETSAHRTHRKPLKVGLPPA